jgi:plasmid stabilization system protein ParE
MEQEYYALIIDIEAYQDIATAKEWYESLQVGLGNRFVLSFDAAIQLLKTNPHIYQKAYEEYRRVLIKKFPYAIFYAIDEIEREVEIIAVFNTNQNPEHLKTKIKKR